ncbi:MAG: flagellar protein FlbB [Treponema sp.]|nr:flagellar protein FlbB [Treponema sp.]
MIGKILALLLLILVLVVGGIFWFDYLNVIDAKTLLAPVYRLAGLQPRAQSLLAGDEPLSLDAERYRTLLSALDLRRAELDTREQDIDLRMIQVEQMVQEIEARQRMLDDRENSLRALAADAENRDKNVEQNARYLSGMPPANAVGIIAGLPDQLVIDVFRMTERIAREEGALSLVSVWLSLMDPARAADIQRRMAASPL